ncbi:hypothetical protein VTH06DRAFT_2231 [Thermothelomyces fergusii]
MHTSVQRRPAKAPSSSPGDVKALCPPRPPASTTKGPARPGLSKLDRRKTDVAKTLRLARGTKWTYTLASSETPSIPQKPRQRARLARPESQVMARKPGVPDD